MKRFWTAIVIALGASAASAQEIPAVSLAPGEAITIRFDDGGRVAHRNVGAPNGLDSTSWRRASSRR